MSYLVLDALKPEQLWLTVIERDSEQSDSDSESSVTTPKTTVLLSRNPKSVVAFDKQNVMNIVLRYDAGICAISDVHFTIPPLGYAIFCQVEIYQNTIYFFENYYLLLDRMKRCEGGL